MNKYINTNHNNWGRDKRHVRKNRHFERDLRRIGA